MTWTTWVLDASMGGPPFCFCPIEGDLDGDYTIVTGMNLVGMAPPKGRVVALVHEDGQEAADAFYQEHKELIDSVLQEAG